ncbi:MAG: alanine racemase, partial [Enterococcus sp.]|nr:alanine racemase [Enterococcus sp.]
WLPLILEYHLAVPVATLSWLEEAALYMATQALTGQLLLHLTVDTGMGRIGFRDEAEILVAIEKIKENVNWVFEGIFTHFATADEADQTYWHKQNQRFKKVVASLPEKPRYIHASNSATALWQEDCGNLVRLGIAMYGQNPSGGQLEAPYLLRPAMSLESALVQVKAVPAGEGIGYGKTYETPATEWVGTVPIGYADGFVRKMQGFKVLVEGQPCEIIGRICMDQLMIRLPQAYPVGTKVTFFGQNQDKEITVQEVADYLGTIHYEVICLLSDRIPREYLNTEGILS